jgi:hypothetical protein
MELPHIPFVLIPLCDCRLAFVAKVEGPDSSIDGGRFDGKEVDQV